MSKSLQSIRGMNDVLPGDTPVWQRFESCVRDVMSAYGYAEVRLPVVEHTELFSRAIGEVTDIVEKEMYTFDDRNGDSLTLRPEGTAGCVRAGINAGLLHNQTQRLWYQGPMFRHERPQKGRYRQFHQVGVEAFGPVGPDVDAEVIVLAARLLAQVGLDDLRLELNSLGTQSARAAYREVLHAYFSGHADELDEDSRRRLQVNPLRILDSRNPGMQALIAAAPSLTDSLDEASRRHFDGLRELLTAAGVEHTVNPRLVRGLDYYSRTVFEWKTDRLGAQDAVCSGGRYDALVELLGGKSNPAIGWALGVERVVELMRSSGVEGVESAPHAYLVLVGDAATRAGFMLAERLRDGVPGLRLVTNCGGGAIGAQLKRADRSGAGYALILGEDELAAGQVTVKPLRADLPQERVALDALPEHLNKRIRSGYG